jgi:sugar/nucleoside kinase (ribokinase family)
MNIAHKPFELEPPQYRQIKFMSPNIYELQKIAETLKPSLSSMTTTKTSSSSTLLRDDKEKYFARISQLCEHLHDIVDNILVTLGSDGVVIQGRRGSEATFFNRNFQYNHSSDGGDRMLRYYAPATVVKADLVSSTGAGDAFNSGFIAAMLKHKSESICVSVGFQAALSALRSMDAVPKEFFNESHPCWIASAKFNIVKP